MSNSNRPQPWPYKAAASADEVTAHQLAIVDLARKANRVRQAAQRAILDGNSSLAIVLLGDLGQELIDIQDHGIRATDTLAKARRGEYAE